MATTVKGAGKRGGVGKGKARAVKDESEASLPVAEVSKEKKAVRPRSRARTQALPPEADAAARVVAIRDAGLARLALTEAGDLSPLAYLLRVMRAEAETPARRMDAAKTAAPFVHPKLATMDMQSAGLDRMGDALAELIERAQGDGGGVGGLLGR